MPAIDPPLTDEDFTVPLYEIALHAGMLDAAARSSLAGKITDLHCEMASVPKDWVHIIFNEYSRGSAFTGGQVAVMVGLTVTIRSGRSPDYKRAMLERLHAVLQAGTGASDEMIVIGILEVPASQALEMGKVMDDV